MWADVYFPSLEDEEERGDETTSNAQPCEETKASEPPTSPSQPTQLPEIPHLPIRFQSPAAAQVTATSLGYEDATPDISKNYGYEKASPSKQSYTYDANQQPRRSSMKGSNGTVSAHSACRGAGVSRRASMGSTATTFVEVKIRGERLPVQRRRSIEFDPQGPTIQTFTPMKALASEHELWLQPEEMDQMKLDRRAAVKKLQLKNKREAAANCIDGSSGSGESTTIPEEEEEEEEEEFRGLEKYVDKTARHRKMNAWDAVLWEQEQQEFNNSFNDEKIKSIYQKTSGGTPEKAALLAAQDAADIQKYLATPRTTKLMLRRDSC
jgi:hypothetical protein